MYGAQRIIWGYVEEKKSNTADCTPRQQIGDTTQWKRYFKELYATDNITTEEDEEDKHDPNITDITITELITRMKNRKAPGPTIYRMN